jgi:hypothetical protein
MPIGLQARRALLLSFMTLTFGCADHVADYQARQQAYSTGKFKVTLTADSEKVLGTCKYVRTIQPDLIPRNKPTDAQLPDYYRAEGAYDGANTVLVEGRTGEAYNCAPGTVFSDAPAGAANPAPTPYR